MMMHRDESLCIMMTHYDACIANWLQPVCDSRRSTSCHRKTGCNRAKGSSQQAFSLQMAWLWLQSVLRSPASASSQGGWVPRRPPPTQIMTTTRNLMPGGGKPPQITMMTIKARLTTPKIQQPSLGDIKLSVLV